MSQSRTNNSLRNAVLTIGMQVTLLPVSFITRTIFISLLGKDYLGISDLYSNILSVLSLTDLGINTVMIYNLYKPLATGDNEALANLVCFFRKAYNVISAVVFGLGMICVPFLQYIVKGSNLPLDQLRLYFILFLANTCISYLNVYKSTLINADQRLYIIKAVEFLASIMLNVGQIVVLYITRNYVFYLLLNIVITVTKNITLSCVADKRYPFLKSIKASAVSNEIKTQIMRQTKATFIYRVSAAIMNSTDNILISMILGTVVVGYYSNYLMILSAINSFIMLVAQSLLASIGNLNATADAKRKLLVFKSMLLAFWGIGTFCACCLLSVFNDFISIWLKSYDAQYILPYKDVAAIAFNFFVGCILTPIWMYRETAGLFNQVKYSMTIAAVINILLSIVLGKLVGLAGIIAATAIAKIATKFWYEPKILFARLFKTSIRIYWRTVLRYLCCALLSVGSVWLLTVFIPTSIWGIALKILISFAVSAIVFVSINANTEEEKYVITTLKKMCRKRGK